MPSPFFYLVLAATLSSCATVSPDITTKKKVAIQNKTEKAKSLKKNSQPKKGLLDAILGGLTGAQRQTYMDLQEKELRKTLDATEISVKRAGNQIILNIPGHSTFPSGQTDISADLKPILESVAKILKHYHQTSIEIAGHTDNLGGTQANQVISEKRAESVSKLFKVLGIDSQRVTLFGYGESQPIAPNSTERGRRANQRLEVTLYSTPSF